MENMRKGFMTAIVLVMMVVASMLLLVLYQGVANYRENAMYTYHQYRMMLTRLI